jgi:hypothetical protein
MLQEAMSAGQFKHQEMGKMYDRISIVTVQEILDGKRLEIPMSIDVLRAAQRALDAEQDDLPF